MLNKYKDTMGFFKTGARRIKFKVNVLEKLSWEELQDGICYANKWKIK